MKLAKDNRARLTIVHALKDVPTYMKSETFGDKPIDVRKLVLRELQLQLTECARAVRSLGVRPPTRLLIGDPSLEIIRDVIENKRDLVIMTAEGKGLKDRLFGSTSSHLMRKCPVPLLVVKPGRQKRVLRVFAAIDPEVTGDARDTLNGIILDLASTFCSREGAELHVVHAWTLFAESLLRRHGGLDAPEAERWIREEAHRRRQLVDELLANHGVADVRLHLVKGEAAQAILCVATREHIDLLVMGTVCRTGIPGFIIGNTAERVLDEVNCSVLTVKPVGFVTPVAPELTKAIT